VWQDRRTEADLRDLPEKDARMIRGITGLMPDAYFSASKLHWQLENIPGLRDRAWSGAAVAGNLDSWLLCRMTAGRETGTDVSTASRTMLMDLSSGAWHPALLEHFGLTRAMLPEILDSARLFGMTDKSAFLGIEAPVTALLIDQQAALFGEGCYAPGDTKVTLGTGGFVYRNAGGVRPPDAGNVLATAAWRLDGKITYALAGDIYTTGAAVNWLRDIGFIDSPAQTEDMARSAGDSGGLTFVPAFSGLASPHWDSTAGGLLIGLFGGTTKQQIVRAVLESTAFQVADVIVEMESVAGPMSGILKADGGMTKNGFLMQFMADITGCAIAAAGMEDATAEGSARAAAIGLGDYQTPAELPGPAVPPRIFEPRMEHAEREQRLETWHRAVRRSLRWREHE
jgi:glycerol kinase